MNTFTASILVVYAISASLDPTGVNEILALFRAFWGATGQQFGFPSAESVSESCRIAAIASLEGGLMSYKAPVRVPSP
jgi:hypothetical protein